MSKPRIALTIAYNAMNHLKHGRFVEFMTTHFDMWVIVEGRSKNGGSTSWCKSIETPHGSTDGTREYIQTLASDKVIVYSHPRYYKSKDEQVNIGIDLIRKRYQSGWLWQIDVDEHWKIDDMEQAERELWRCPYRCAEFQFNHYVKPDIIAVGSWGSGWVNRLWKWTGQKFQSHEPAVLFGQGEPMKLPQKFDHYSLIFEDDVKFKSKFYRGHEPLYTNWQKLDSLDWSTPQHISVLFGSNNPIGKSETYLIKTDTSCVNVQNQDGLKGSEVITTLIDNHATITRNRKYHRRGSRNIQAA